MLAAVGTAITTPPERSASATGQTGASAPGSREHSTDLEHSS